MVFEVSRPPGCTHGTGNCKRSVRFFRSSETHITFDLEGDEAGWVAVGFSTTQDMVCFSVVVVVAVVVVFVFVVDNRWEEDMVGFSIPLSLLVLHGCVCLCQDC